MLLYAASIQEFFRDVYLSCIDSTVNNTQVDNNTSLDYYKDECY